MATASTSRVSLDVRALIKQLKADFGRKQSDAGKEPDLAIHASSIRRPGYNGEVLRNFKIDYQSAPGSKSEKNWRSPPRPTSGAS